MAGESARLMPPLAPTPVISVARLREKIADLDKQRQQHLANAHACAGAIQLAQALIVDLEGDADA
jgi:hypothetical protein